MAQAKMKIKKGDEVIILTGKDKGKKGEVIEAIPAAQRVIVKGVNVATMHKRATQFDAGGIKKEELSIHISNVALADPKGGKATRVGYKILKDGKKVRIAKKSGETLESKK